jgi:hypothetical protein
MTLLNAPEYDEGKEKRKVGLLVGSGILLAVVVVTCLGGYLLGHGWFFSNLPAEHRVNTFFEALEAKDYAKAYGIYWNDPEWQQHPQKYSYPLTRFTEDWTTESPISAAITSHHVDISKTDGSGKFGTGIIVATRVNGEHKVFMYYIRKDGTLAWPAPHELEY